jgi:transmembrane sensor
MDGIAPADVAERWHARLMSPDCTLAEREKFEAWLRQSPENALAFEDTKALWASLEGLEDDDVIGPHAAAALLPDAEHFMGQWSRATEGMARRVSPARPRVRWPLGAGIAVALALVAVLWPGLKPGTPIQTYAASDRIESIRLPDGSSVRLDLDTAIDAKFDTRRRDIDFRGGRAMFDVARDAGRPFVVDAGVGTVTALGTRFQVQRKGDRVSITLLEGAVGIATAGDGGARSLRLVPGQTAHYAPQTRSWTVEATDAAALTSWSQGFHVFGATPLREALAEINRYSDVKLVLTDPALGDLALSGSFKLGDGRAVSEALPHALPVKAREQGGEIVISRR